MLKFIPFRKPGDSNIRPSWTYDAASRYTDDDENCRTPELQLNEKQVILIATPKRRFYYIYIFFGISILFMFYGGVLIWKDRIAIGVIPVDHSKHCHKPYLRKEWRSMNATLQQEYISAVVCLRNHPSIIHRTTSYYDDFVYVHTQSAKASHYAAAFLPWHRMYVRAYEQALQEKCGYTGFQPYWDWTLDSADLSKSPIWDPVHGFGGNGELNTPVTIHNGHCVSDGPFANSKGAWHARSNGEFHGVAHEPHCLSRGFLNAGMASQSDLENSTKLHSRISPAHVERLLDQPDYLSFFEFFESGAHNAIPQFLRGDWLVFSAPNDPVFFLHHTQVDRLWWLWQQRDVETRSKDYTGPKEDFRHHPESTGSKVSDILSTDDFVPDEKVEDFMDTKNGRNLCYEY